uniref:HAT C-terminal dimerisation domain-containing protein n=1 Tax=Amphimedon queenslandica TaxID=400682 RepID=A0A1X7VHM7_AMPQE
MLVLIATIKTSYNQWFVSYHQYETYATLLLAKSNRKGYIIRGYHNTDPGVLVSKLLTNFKKALDILRNHVRKEHHLNSIVRRDNFLKVMSQQQPPISSVLNQTTANQVAQNRLKLASISKTIFLCGRQNISLRGHQDNFTDIERDTACLHNHGNFMALLNFRVDAGDVVLRDHLSKASRNATYTSSVIQNQLMDILSKQVRQHIIDIVKVAKWFCIIADEVTHVSNKEILSLVVRYCEPDSLPCEDLVGFFQCNEGITGRQLANMILTHLQSFGLDLSYLRGQAYDGAGNMSWSIRVVVKSLALTSVRNIMNIVRKVYFFEAHLKRQRKLEDVISDTQPGSSTDIIHAVKEIETITSTIQNIRDNIDTYHDELFPEIKQVCDTAGTVPSTPRTRARQTHRSNTPASSPSEYYLHTISIPLIDHLLSELKSRFSSHQSVALLGLCIVPSAMLVLPVPEFLTHSFQLADKYKDDLLSPNSFASERECWKVKWQRFAEEHGTTSLPSDLATALQQVSSMYPNITVLQQIFSTLPVTTCSAERSFISLKRTKTPFHSTMTTERLTGLSLLHIHKDIQIDVEGVIDEFSLANPRRMQVADILTD